MLLKGRILGIGVWMIFLVSSTKTSDENHYQAINHETHLASHGHTEYSLCLPSKARSRIGVLILAHGGTPRWDALVVKVVEPLLSRVPVCIAFGMAFFDSSYILEGLRNLKQGGVTEIRVLPLFISSAGGVPRQMEYIFHRAEQPVARAVQRANFQAKLRYLSPIDGDLAIGKMLRDFALEKSENSQMEYVFLIGHGPITDEDDRVWHTQFSGWANQISAAGFAGVEVGTIRDDAPAEIRERAIQKIRSRMVEIQERYQIIVVPVLISSKDIQSKIQKELGELNYQMVEKVLVEHPDFAHWLRRKLHLSEPIRFLP